MSAYSHHIPDEAFDKTHDFYDAKGDRIVSAIRPSIRSSWSVMEVAPDDVDDESNLFHSVASAAGIHSVYLADGIRQEITEGVSEDLLHRFEAGSVKARFTWFGTLCLAGIGMFVEAYIIITTGQVKSIWHAAYPTCFGPHSEQVCPTNIECCGLFPNTPTNSDGSCSINTTLSSMCSADGGYEGPALCNPGILHAQSYSSFAGIMLGMLVFGMLVDKIGRNSAGIFTSILMVVGVLIMSFVRADDLQTMFLVWAISFGLFGLGVGGEYPLSASGAADYHAQVFEEAKLDDEERRRLRVMRNRETTVRRGETIGIVFGMQGIGAVCGSIFLLVLLYFSGNYTVEWYDNLSITF